MSSVARRSARVLPRCQGASLPLAMLPHTYLTLPTPAYFGRCVFYQHIQYTKITSTHSLKMRPTRRPSSPRPTSTLQHAHHPIRRRPRRRTTNTSISISRCVNLPVLLPIYFQYHLQLHHKLTHNIRHSPECSAKHNRGVNEVFYEAARVSLTTKAKGAGAYGGGGGTSCVIC